MVAKVTTAHRVESVSRARAQAKASEQVHDLHVTFDPWIVLDLHDLHLGLLRNLLFSEWF